MTQWRAAYPLIMLAGLTISYLAFRKRSVTSSLDTQSKTAIALAAFIGAMLGAKIPFWLTPLAESPSLALWMADGKTILGGIFGGYLAVELTKWILRIHERTGDQFAVPVAIAVATGRLGCFVAGCCFGLPTDMPWGVAFTSAGDNLARHPTQLYEFGFHALAACCLLILERQHWLRSRRLAAYLLCYLVYRFVTEWIRPEPQFALGLTAYQIACVLLAAMLVVSEYVAKASAPGDATTTPP